LVLIVDAKDLLDERLVFLSEIAVVLDFHNLSFISLEIILNVVPGLEMLFASTLRNSLLDIMGVAAIIVDVELFEILVELLWGRLTNGFSLLHEVIGDLISAKLIFGVSLLVQDHLLGILIVDSFSHVLVLLQSDHFLDIPFDNCDELLVNFWLILGGSFGELVSLSEQFFNILLSDLSKFFIDFTFHLGFVTISVCVGIARGADLFG
jgi:hypothetical protein|tara:strand:- start:133 stop:756 length:624 start_codon:yes stop_codon:yes gene_type:complete